MTELSETFADLLRRVEDSEDYWLDVAVSDFARDLHARMQALGIKHKDLAERMGTSRPYVTRLLSGGNFTLQTMVKLAMALDAVVRVRLEGREARALKQETAEAVAADSGRTVVDMRKRRPGLQRAEMVADGNPAEPLAAAWGR